MGRRNRTAPDGDSRSTSSSDPYLGDVARAGRAMGSSTRTPAGCTTHGWDGVNRREDDVGCFDPYLVETARGDSTQF